MFVYIVRNIYFPRNNESKIIIQYVCIVCILSVGANSSLFFIVDSHSHIQMLHTHTHCLIIKYYTDLKISLFLLLLNAGLPSHDFEQT